jgi:hypothetical protein
LLQPILLALTVLAIAAATPAHAQTGPYRLLILTPQEFKLPLMLFSSHKDATGMPTLIVTVEEINTNPAYASGRDIQEKIKLPVRYTRGGDSVTSGHFYAPSDLYYANLVNKADTDSWDNPDTGLFDDWDRNRNNFIGEMGRKDGQARNWGELNVDAVDLKPDVAVGRLPVSNAAELSTLLAKIIVYEQQRRQPLSKRVCLTALRRPHPTAMQRQRLARLATATKRYGSTTGPIRNRRAGEASCPGVR